MKTHHERARETAEKLFPDYAASGNPSFRSDQEAATELILSALTAATADIIAKNAPEIAKANARLAELEAEVDALRSDKDHFARTDAALRRIINCYFKKDREGLLELMVDAIRIQDAIVYERANAARNKEDK